MIWDLGFTILDFEKGINNKIPNKSPIINV